MSDYVRGLRAKIGHDFLLMPTVAARIADGRGRLLLVQHVEGRWQLPGGAVDPGEHPADALRRECREEASVEVELGALIGAFGGPEYTATYANGDRAGFVTTVYDATIAAGEPQPGDDEIQAVGWFTPAEIEGLEMGDATRATIRAISHPVRA
ncbi:MAG TPA: NUDIX domain-containing protein [Gaiellaceae bacterium]